MVLNKLQAVRGLNSSWEGLRRSLKTSGIRVVVMAYKKKIWYVFSMCTSFRIQAEDGTVVVGRSNEFGIDAQSQIVFEPSGKKFSSTTPEGGVGLEWTSNYAFLGINGLGLKECFGDGMNEAGLSVEALYFTEGEYEPPGERNISSNDLVTWLLGNFATILEVKEALPTVSVWPDSVEAIGGPFMLHYAIHDASGASLVLEFIKGEKQLHDNPIGVMTNLPEFPWHLTNLRNYLALRPSMPKPSDFSGEEIKPIGTGSGWLGIPGDWSPPSRFVRIAYLVETTPKAKTRDEAVSLARHILNTVDIPKGSVLAELRGSQGGTDSLLEYTQWSVLLDLSNRIFHYHTYDDTNIRSINLQQLAATRKEPLVLTMEGNFFSQDMTAQMSVL